MASRLCPWGKHMIKLSNRLMAVAGFIAKGASVADVGSDHGLLPVFLAQSGLARRIIASDISAGSLEAARRSAAKHGVADLIRFVVAPGLSGVGESEADTVVVAGLGGETIAGILGDAPWTRLGARLVLQPQSKIIELCSWLRENGYAVRDARLASDRGKLYVVLLVEGGQPSSGLEPEQEYLALLASRGDPLLASYLEKLAAKEQAKQRGRK